MVVKNSFNEPFIAMASFCEWAAAVKLDTPEAIKLSQSFNAGLAKLKMVLVTQD